jgi:hypothetical protein
MAHLVKRRPLALQARVRAHVSPCEISGGQNGTGTGFDRVLFACQYHSTEVLHTYHVGSVGLRCLKAQLSGKGYGVVSLQTFCSLL